MGVNRISMVLIVAYDLFTKKHTPANYTRSASPSQGPILSGPAKIACGVGLAILLAQIARRTTKRVAARLAFDEPELSRTQKSRAITDRDLVFGNKE